MTEGISGPVAAVSDSDLSQLPQADADADAIVDTPSPSNNPPAVTVTAVINSNPNNNSETDANPTSTMPPHPVTPTERKASISWKRSPQPGSSRAGEEGEGGAGMIEIEELPPSRPSSAPLPTKLSSLIPPARPMKQGWRQRRSQENENVAGISPVATASATAAKNNDNIPNSSNTNNTNNPNSQNKNQTMGSKPKQSNLSLLSSAVAYATLERCLLGVNGGILSEDDPQSPGINYSKQCKLGHVIDILELRRLSSRGVPDEPPELKARSSISVSASSSRSASPSPLVVVPPPPLTEGSGHDDAGEKEEGEISHSQSRQSEASQGRKGRVSRQSSDGSMRGSYTTSSNNVQGPGGNPHRSYRPLVWRVLLGYLPPQTELWNDVLARDRKLYANLVKELFSSTCPAPHEMYDEEYLKNVAVRSDENNNNHNANGDDTPMTPGQSTPKELFQLPNSTPSATSTPVMTPGLLSARMQQEWIRGEDSIFKSPGGENSGNNDHGSSEGRNNPMNRRLSPMCAMNTPRVRSNKKPLPSAGTVWEESPGANGDGATTAGSTSVGTDGNSSTPMNGDSEKGEDGAVTGMMNSLLLPDDGESDDEEGENTNNKGDERNSKNDTNDNNTKDAQVNKIHIDHKNAGNGPDEGVELRQVNNSPWGIDSDDDDEDNSTGVHHSTSMDLDEEENMLLLDEIRKDVIRTHPDLRFFLEPKEDLGQKRYAALERILFVWAKLNKGVRYVQGMNEIVGTLYFVLAHDSNEDWANEAEADTYFLFNSLMVEMRDVFVPDLDEADTGIHGRISNMISLLSLHDPEVRCHLDSVGIDPSFYSVRWLTTLLSREFLLPDTIRLWDSMFASTHKDNFLRYVSVTMVMVIRDQLLEGDFSTCLRLLQAYPPTNLDRLLESSRALWIYESQITLACHKGGISLGHALRSINPPPAIIMAYGLHGGVAPPISEQVRQVGERGLAAARGAANGASSTMANAGRSFFGNALGFWRTGSNTEGREKKDNNYRRSKTTM